MPKLFVSYRRKSWPFTQRLADELRARLDAELFVDFAGVDEADFERSILRHLRESDAVLLVVTEYTFEDRIHRDDDWVRREIREALRLKKPLVLVCVDGRLPPGGLPDDIQAVARMQGVNFYPEYFTAAVDRLAEFIIKIGVARARTGGAAPDPAPPGEKAVLGRAALDEALDLMDSGDYAKAAFLLEALREAGYSSRVADLDDLLRQAGERVQAEREYDEILSLANRKFTQERAGAAYWAWRRRYPALAGALDHANLRERFPFWSRYSRIPGLLPAPFEWRDIPAGRVTLTPDDYARKNSYLKAETTFDVPAFAIARYPATNAQFARFVEAGGYKERRWWTDAGWEARLKGWAWDGRKRDWVATNTPWAEPRFWRDGQFNGAEQPVVGVSWYEAVAFCLWLSEVSGEAVTLPTEQQWQRAAQGDDGRDYPWGPGWDASCCNHNIDGKGLGRTTPVRQYEGRGDSFFGVADMAGNIWEWCLTDYDRRVNDIHSPANSRVLRGGSWNLGDTDFFRCDYRVRINPHGRGDYWGFRLSLS